MDVAELAGGAGCARITTTLTPRYTAAHPDMGAVSRRLEGGPTGPTAFVLSPGAESSGGDDQFGAAVPDPDPVTGWTVAGLAPCS